MKDPDVNSAAEKLAILTSAKILESKRSNKVFWLSVSRCNTGPHNIVLQLRLKWRKRRTCSLEAEGGENSIMHSGTQPGLTLPINKCAIILADFLQRTLQRAKHIFNAPMNSSLLLLPPPPLISLQENSP